MQNCSTTIESLTPTSPGRMMADGARLLAGGFMLIVIDVLDSVLSAMDDAAARRHLHSLDTRMLRDIGISRSEIDHVTKR